MEAWHKPSGLRQTRNGSSLENACADGRVLVGTDDCDETAILNDAEAVFFESLHSALIKVSQARPPMRRTHGAGVHHPGAFEIMGDVPKAKELGVEALASTVRGFAVLSGVPEDRQKILCDGLVKAMEHTVYQGYLANGGMPASSVVGQDEWNAHIDRISPQHRGAVFPRSIEPLRPFERNVRHRVGPGRALFGGQVNDRPASSYRH